MLSVQLPPFGTDGAEGRIAAEAVKAGIEANFGTTGPVFAARLQARLADDGGAGKLRTRHQELTEMLRGSTDMAARRTPLGACMALAAELAEQWAIVPFAAPEAASRSGLFASDEQRDNRPEMALDLVREYVAAHADKMCGSNDGSHPPASGWIGHEAKEGPALLPEKLREELRRRGYEVDAVLPARLEMGALLTMDRQRPSHLIPRRTAGRQSRHLVFRREVIDPRIQRTASEKYMSCTPLQTITLRKLRTTLKTASDLDKGRYAPPRTAHRFRSYQYVLRTSCVPARVPAS